jgi:hypothetical protein
MWHSDRRKVKHSVLRALVLKQVFLPRPEKTVMHETDRYNAGGNQKTRKGSCAG